MKDAIPGHTPFLFVFRFFSLIVFLKKCIWVILPLEPCLQELFRTGSESDFLSQQIGHTDTFTAVYWGNLKMWNTSQQLIKLLLDSVPCVFYMKISSNIFFYLFCRLLTLQGTTLVIFSLMSVNSLFTTRTPTLGVFKDPPLIAFKSGKSQTWSHRSL